MSFVCLLNDLAPLVVLIFPSMGGATNNWDGNRASGPMYVSDMHSAKACISGSGTTSGIRISTKRCPQLVLQGGTEARRIISIKDQSHFPSHCKCFSVLY